MTKHIICQILALLIALPVFAATLYMGSEETYTNLQAAMAAMSAGDTLIIRDGTYTGTTNQIDSSHLPPSNDTLWTTIKAEHDGEVLFDGQGARTMFYLSGSEITNRHWIFEGLIWGNSSADNVNMGWCSYVKFLRCGAFEAGTAANVNNIFIASSSYILVDGCYTWGRGRTGVTAWGSSAANRSDHIIFRNNVSRIDRVTAGEPSYNFGMYSVNYGLVQNCIAIDSDQTEYYANTSSSWAGGLAVADTDYQADNVTFRNSIVLNSVMGGITVAGNNPANNILYDNVVVADAHNRSDLSVNQLWGVQDVVDHSTFYLSETGYAGINGYGGTGPHTLTNSILTGYTADWTCCRDYQITGDYNNIYNNAGSSSTSTYTNTNTSNPIWDASTNPTGALKYITRIETGSNLSGQGSSGDIGANLTTLRGTTGTIWGETGYDTDTGVSMWPYPNEALIKSKMSAYTGGGVNGARGFAAPGKQLNGTSDVTLTSYIWEYLGNQMPADIYGTTTQSFSGVTSFAGCLLQ